MFARIRTDSVGERVIDRQSDEGENGEDMFLTVLRLISDETRHHACSFELLTKNLLTFHSPQQIERLYPKEAVDLENKSLAKTVPVYACNLLPRSWSFILS